MLTYPRIDPVAFTVGPIDIYWYGVMYLLAFTMAWGLGQYRARKPNSGWTAENVNDLVFYCALGIILGGRIGYVIFYNFNEWIHDPSLIVRLWEGGMSFHGGLLGVVLAVFLFARKTHKYFLEVGDFVAPLVPLGLAAGRIGNFINAELWGRITDVPWALVFPRSDGMPRHPSQLYEFALEGLLLFVILWWFSSHSRPRGAVSGLFLIGYAVFRFSVEFYREPDRHIGFVLLDWMSMGQLLCIPMFLFGVLLLKVAKGSSCSK